MVLLQVTDHDFDGAVARAQSIVTASSAAGGRDHVGDSPVGVVWTWGNGRFGQLGRGMSPKEQQFSDPRPVSILGGLGYGKYSNDGSAGILTRKIVCGSNHTAALTAAGTLWTWGYNRHGCLGRPTREPYKYVESNIVPGRDTVPTETSHSGMRSVETYAKKIVLPDNLLLVGGIPRMVHELTGFPRGRITDVGCGPDMTIVCTAPWTGIGPIQIKALEDCAARCMQSTMRKFLSKIRNIRRLKQEYAKIWHLKRQKFYYLHEPTNEKYWKRPSQLGNSDEGIRVIKNTQSSPSKQSYAEDVIQWGPQNKAFGVGGTFVDGSPGIPYDEHAVLLHDWNHTNPYRKVDPLRISLGDGRTDRSKWPEWPHEGKRTMSALPAMQFCKPRKPSKIPTLKNGDNGEEAFLKEIMEPDCRCAKGDDVFCFFDFLIF